MFDQEFPDSEWSLFETYDVLRVFLLFKGNFELDVAFVMAVEHRVC